MSYPEPLRCQISGVGAYGPGFSSWPELTRCLKGEKAAATSTDEPAASAAFSAPKPLVIPANERRRAPLPVKLAVETSQQALTMAQLTSADVACVFGSGLGDMENTDYLCRTLNSEQKQLSPTKFHNSVHNAAAGYWTISTQCMRAANSVAANQLTFSVALLEALSQCVAEQTPVLLTLFDTPVTPTMRDTLKNPYPFAASIVLQPDPKDSVSNSNSADTRHALTAQLKPAASSWPSLEHAALQDIYQLNPAAKILVLLAKMVSGHSEALTLPLSFATTLEFTVNTV